jgi:hypothetical protein
MTAPVPPASTIRLIVIAKDNSRLHVYPSVNDLLGDPLQGALDNVDFFTAGGLRLDRQPAVGPIAGLRFNPAPADEPAVQNRIDLVVDTIEARIDNTKTFLKKNYARAGFRDRATDAPVAAPGSIQTLANAMLERAMDQVDDDLDAVLNVLQQLDGKTLAQRYDLLIQRPLGHGVGGLGPFHTDDPGGWLHMLLFH